MQHRPMENLKHWLLQHEETLEDFPGENLIQLEMATSRLMSPAFAAWRKQPFHVEMWSPNRRVPVCVTLFGDLGEM